MPRYSKCNNSKIVIFFFLFFTRQSTHCTSSAGKSFKALQIILFEISHLQHFSVQNLNRGNKSKISYIIPLFSNSAYHPLSADTIFKLLALTLFEMWPLQYFIPIFSKGRYFTRGDYSGKASDCYFFMRILYMKFQDDTSFRNITVEKFSVRI